MSFRNQIIVILSCYFVSFIFIRGFLYGIKRYQLNNSAYKKRKKDESFLEWLFYSRYRKEIPKILFILYICVLFIHPICILACLLMYFIELQSALAYVLVTGLAIIDVIWISLIGLLFWSLRPGFAYERWINKNRGQKGDRK